MSPTAIQRLTSSYRKLHFILYGPGVISSTSNCSSGNCGDNTPTSTDTNLIVKPSQPMREKAEELVSKTENDMLRKLASYNARRHNQ